MTPKQAFYMLSLGCAKNTVDSDSMARLLTRAGYQGVTDPAQAGVLIVNTCGFIDPARQESVGELRTLADQKRPDQLLIAAGCLSQHYGARLAESVPGLDGIIGTRRWMDIVQVVKHLGGRREPLYHLPADAAAVGRDERGVFRASLNGASAYMKISDGCRRPCAFCTIPLFKGTHVSRPLQTLVDEAVRLQAMGTQEIILIAQDSTDYGHDLGMKHGLACLLEAITDAAPGIPWVRLMYAYPGYVTDELIRVMAERPQLLPYLDIPLQHGSRAVLRRMRRPANTQWVHDTLGKLRDAMPGMAIRTTLIVGYPGETEAEFQELVDFVDAMQFDRVGVFTYSFEPDTPSATQAGQVAEATKQARRDHLMARQHAISLARNQALVGHKLDVLVEGHGTIEDEHGSPTDQVVSVGRSYRDAPEVDGLVFIEGELPAGEIVPVRVTGAMAYDLLASTDK